MSDLDKINFLKGSVRYQRAPEKGIQITLPISGKEKEIDEYQRTLSVNLAELYVRERAKSQIFEPTCKIQLFFSNSYSGVAVNSGNIYNPFNNNLFYLTPEKTKQEQVNSVELIPWPGYPQYNEFNFIRTDLNTIGYTLGAGSHRVLEARYANKYNWNYYMSYAFENDTQRVLSYDFKNGLGPVTWKPEDGLPYIMNQVQFEGKTLWQFTCPMNHNLENNNYVQFSNVSIVDSLGTITKANYIFKIYSFGNGLFNSEERIFNILDIGYFENVANSFSPGKTGFFHRILDINNPVETKSIYYIRKHKIITEPENSILTFTGFEQNAFKSVKRYESKELTPNLLARVSTKEDSQTYNLSFDNPFNINGLLDNHKRPISDFYFTIVNRGYFGYFNPPNIYNKALKVGWEFNVEKEPTLWWERNNPNSDVNLSVQNFSSNGVLFRHNKNFISGDTIDGPFCEWNNLTQKETVLSEVFHKFVFNQSVFSIGSNINNPLGYYYNPFLRLGIRYFSDYIEEGDFYTTEFAPNYAYYSKFKNKLIWRDIYDFGFVDENGGGLDFPFLNNRHYPFDNFIFRIIPEGSNISSLITDIEDPIVDECEQN
jgi:hypothetical protein